jgi:hypothetical protein
MKPNETVQQALLEAFRIANDIEQAVAQDDYENVEDDCGRIRQAIDRALDILGIPNTLPEDLYCYNK